ncbi:MAG: hypothetical protein Fur0021_03980 [Candidatus Promineifilaceae bacterium]
MDVGGGVFVGAVVGVGGMTWVGGMGCRAVTVACGAAAVGVRLGWGRAAAQPAIQITYPSNQNGMRRFMASSYFPRLNQSG